MVCGLCGNTWPLTTVRLMHYKSHNKMVERWQRLTFLRDDPKGDTKAGVLDQLDDVGMRHADDRLTVDGQDAVAHLQAAAAVGRAALDDAADFVGHSWKMKKTNKVAGRHFGHLSASATDTTLNCWRQLPRAG